MAEINRKGDETSLDPKTTVNTLALTFPTNFTIGSLTTENVQGPQGEVMKLTLSDPASTPAESQQTEPIFGKHLREAVAIVKDWRQRP